ncbi:hypothetical protein HY496_03345 [Candidatus Woesearchaeota archaeon]|nr:hypothetical protein [Candidatus Woesearchaeota archaeon]
MKRKNPLNPGQIEAILTYDSLPTSRADLLDILSIANYERINGNGRVGGIPVEEASDKQLYAVARRIYDRAYEMKYALSAEEKAALQEEYQRPTIERDYYQRLCGFFNLNPQDEEYSIDDLERMLIGE